MSRFATLLLLTLGSTFSLARPDPSVCDGDDTFMDCERTTLQERVQNFHNWAVKNCGPGYTNGGFEIRETMGGLGLFATREFLANETMIEFNQTTVAHFAVSWDNVTRQGPLPGYQNWAFDAEPFMLFILKERLNKTSFWQPYLDLLPKNMDHMLERWSKAEAEELQNSEIKGLRNQRLATLTSSFHAMLKLLEDEVAYEDVFPPGYMTYDRWFWAHEVVASRIWSTGANSIMLPVFDLLNHEPGAGLVQLRLNVSVSATRNYNAGDQLHDSYGRRSNLELLKSYGFLIENNPDDRVEVKLQYVPSETIKASQSVALMIRPVLEEAGLLSRTVALYAGEDPHDFLITFRLSFMEFEEMKYLVDCLDAKPVSLMNEMRTYRQALIALSDFLKGFATTVQEDTDLLLRRDISPRLRTAVMFRLGHKRLILAAMDQIKALWQSLILPPAVSLPLDIPFR